VTLPKELGCCRSNRDKFIKPDQWFKNEQAKKEKSGLKMSKPKKKRLHRCRTSLPKRDKYGQKFVCRSCGNKVIGYEPFGGCSICGGRFFKEQQNDRTN